MNAKLARCLIGGLCMVLACHAAYASNLSDMLRDPLLARPPALDRSAPLPGDERAVSCPVAVDFEKPLSLLDAVDFGICNNLHIRAAWAAIKLQAASVGEARAAYLPNASISASRLHTRTQYPGAPEANTLANGPTLNTGVTWRLFDAGARDANRAVANYALEAALANHEATMQKAMSDVIGAYFDAQAADAALAARTESTALAQGARDAAQRRLERGVAAQNDVLQAATALANAKLAEHRARAADQAARAALLYVLGGAPSLTLRLPEIRYTGRRDLVDDLRHWMDQAALRHPAIVAAKAQFEAAQAKIGVARSEGLPTIDVAGNFYQNGYPNQGLQAVRTNVTTVSLTLTVPLFDRFARGYKVSGAQAQAEQSKAQWQDTEHEILTDVIKAHAAAASAAANLQASEELQHAAQASLASSQRRYAMGAADVLELLSAQSALANARQERVRALTEWESSRLKLAAAAGVLGEAWIPHD
jgi:outer membrane protein